MPRRLPGYAPEVRFPSRDGSAVIAAGFSPPLHCSPSRSVRRPQTIPGDSIQRLDLYALRGPQGSSNLIWVIALGPGSHRPACLAANGFSPERPAVRPELDELIRRSTR
jgi:hypothetical protein